MPRRRDWHELPEKLRRQIEQRTGAVHAAYSVPTGASCDLAAVVDTDTGRVFCKGGETEGLAAWLYRNEARVNPWLPDGAPRLHWTVEAEGWLILGFEYVAGRHPDLAPGSPDLTAVADLLTAQSRLLTPSPPVQVQRFADRWRGLIAPGLVDGDTLLHTDMTPRNFLVADRLRLVDWSSPARGAAWIDTALMLVRLVRAGHPPAEAEAWAAQIPTWAHASDEALYAFADGLVCLWERKQRSTPGPHHGPLLRAACEWRGHRATRKSR
ncbi:hypothetical protein ACFFMR_07490 [Micromonospora andamanensis]|uniref:Aminoglycoside phosphotransferase n=1 Tax=Micromonospora andamanensis TaxID=1287068 RepID=A0ABQ4HMH8_9ACTN|nr:hypothetical protein [Micromonospora andamanensis]GIJ06850.1 hypothetical protein Van01_00640 [Micromonospora andamanensis]